MKTEIMEQNNISQVKYFYHAGQQVMYKRIGLQLSLVLLQIVGRDLSAPFSHRHERITFPSEERLQETISGCSESFAQDWENLLNEYAQVTKAKLEYINHWRQREYEAGRLKL